MPFQNYASQEIQQKTVTVALPQLQGPTGPAVLHVLHAGEGNEEYLAEVVRDADEDTKINAQIRAAKSADERAALETIRELRMKERYKRTIVKGIDNVFHDDRRPATVDDIPEFISAMPSHAFWALVAFCRDSANWIDVPAWPDAAAAAEK